MRLIDLSGQRFGRLIVLRRDGVIRIEPAWLCKCDCGKEHRVGGQYLRGGFTTSCGCVHSEQAAAQCRERLTTHSGSYTRLYKIWANMHYRCSTPSSGAFKWYGAKGVSVCAEWMSFDGFRSWAAASGYADDLTIDRLDSNGNYEPANCEWVSRGENTRRMNASKKIA